jgi:RNA polymerase sigma-70 factor (ECF subfamily)
MLRLAARTTTVLSTYSLRTYSSMDRSTDQLYVAAARRSAGEWVLAPAGGNAASRKTREPVRTIIARMRWDGLSDEELIARYRAQASKSGSEQYVNELFRRHHVKVARWCLSFTNDRESAADLAQEICAKAYKNLSSFSGQSKFSTWLFSIARNHCLNAVRARSSLPAMDPVHLFVDTLPDLASENPDAAMETKQLAKIARQLVCEALEETERVVFTLHFVEELPLDVITRMLNLTNASGAKAYLVSAKRKLERAVRIWKAKV